MAFSSCNPMDAVSPSSACLCPGSGSNQPAASELGHTSIMIALGSEMEGLSLAEHESAYNELHCILQPRQEDPAEIEEGLRKLDRTLQQLKRTSNGYRIAREQNQTYVEDRKFRLMFLRADEYDPKQAAQRLARFFDEKLRLFGKEKLTEDILYQDLDEDDRECLECGAMQYAPVNDRAGRRIFFGLSSKKKYKVVDNYLRAQFYMLMSVVDDESVQLLGLTGIVYTLDSNTNDTAIIWSTASLRAALPIRISSCHLCLRNSTLFTTFRLASSLIQSKVKAADRANIGTHTECMYALMGYGIPVYGLPFRQDDGTPTTENQRRWLEERKETDRKRLEIRKNSAASDTFMTLDCLDDNWSLDLESDNGIFFGESILNSVASLPAPREKRDDPSKQMPTTERWSDGKGDTSSAPISTNGKPLPIQEPSDTRIRPGCLDIDTMDINVPSYPSANETSSLQGNKSILMPTHVDVLLGRGNGVQKHPGNKTFRDLITSKSDAYEQADRKKKVQMTVNVLKIVKGGRGRFLKLAENSNNTNVNVWEEISDTDARLKIASAFRSMRKDRLRNGCSQISNADLEASVRAFYSADLTLATDADFPGAAPSSVDTTLSTSKDTTPADVLFGRGRGLINHPGNIVFRNLIASRLDEYDMAPKRRKVELVGEIIGRIKESSGRFLKRLDHPDGGWEQVDDETAHSKVASAFRSVRKMSKQGEKKLPRKVLV